MGLGLASLSFTPDVLPTASQPRALDPTLAADILCADRRSAMNPARALLAAAAIAAPASDPGAIPLYPDLTASPFPVSTASPEPWRVVGFRRG
jgi:hypothetical protein